MLCSITVRPIAPPLGGPSSSIIWVDAADFESLSRASEARLNVRAWPAAAGCRRLPSLDVLQKRGWVSAHSRQQPDHICCCSSSSARRVWPRDSMSHESSRMSDSDGSEPTTARRQTRSSQQYQSQSPFSVGLTGALFIFHLQNSSFKRAQIALFSDWAQPAADSIHHCSMRAKLRVQSCPLS